MTPSPLIEEGLPLLTRAGGVATLTLRRPSQRNSLTDDDLLALLAHFESLNADPSVRVLVLTADTRGQGRPVFSAGYNVAGFNKDPESPQFFERVADALEKARPITVCALNGSVYGGATDLVLACDLRVALRGMEWRMPACALGLLLVLLLMLGWGDAPPANPPVQCNCAELLKRTSPYANCYANMATGHLYDCATEIKQGSQSGPPSWRKEDEHE
jgi:hypothetical protein